MEWAVFLQLRSPHGANSSSNVAIMITIEWSLYPRLMDWATTSLKTGRKIVTRCHSVFCVYSPDTCTREYASKSSSSVEASRPTQQIIGRFGDDFYRLNDQTNSVTALKETSWSSRSGLNPTWTTPPCYNNTTLGNRLYAIGVPMWQTQSVWPVRTAHISVLRTVNIVSHDPAQSSSDNIPS